MLVASRARSYLHIALSKSRSFAYQPNHLQAHLTPDLHALSPTPSRLFRRMTEQTQAQATTKPDSELLPVEQSNPASSQPSATPVNGEEDTDSPAEKSKKGGESGVVVENIGQSSQIKPRRRQSDWKRQPRLPSRPPPLLLPEELRRKRRRRRRKRRLPWSSLSTLPHRERRRVSTPPLAGELSTHHRCLWRPPDHRLRPYPGRGGSLRLVARQGLLQASIPGERRAIAKRHFQHHFPSPQCHGQLAHWTRLDRRFGGHDGQMVSYPFTTHMLICQEAYAGIHCPLGSRV